LKRFFSYFKILQDVWYFFVLAILCGALYGVATGFGLPFMTEKVFPTIFGEGDVTPRQRFLMVSLLPLAFAIRGVSGFFNTYLISYCGAYILENLRQRVFVKFQELPQSFFQKHPAGDLLSRTIADTELLQNQVVSVANDLVKQPITFLGAIGVLVYLALQKPELTYVLGCLTVIPISVFPIRYIGRKVQNRARQMQAQAGDLSATVSENISATREIRAFNLQDSEKQKFGDVIRHLFKSRMKVIKYNNLLTPAIEIIASTGIAAAVFYAAQKNVSLEELTPVIMALYLSYEPLKKLGGIHTRLRQATASLDRIEYILEHPLEVKDPDKPIPFENVKGKLEFRNVTFRYDSNPALKEINVTIDPGQIVALVGPSGAGKTTFANLILRFFDPAEGNLLIDDTDLRNISQNDLRHNIAYVPQNPRLFNVSARENILLGRTDNSTLSVEDAAQQAYAHKFIQELPDGYDTRLGEKGSRLSGGQIQRIAIARALLRNAPILILDEATSALDAESEHTIQQALRNLVQDKTVFIIAHRFSTISLANRILVFKEGSIIADGAHDQIIKGCDLYRRLHDGQKTAS
jgi:subfamily B ATP-binding cassette protein MsbA